MKNMLKKIGIENFKAFAHLQELNLAPITLIYGANSSGKSSIIHSLMVLKQSILFSTLKGGVYSDKRVLDVGNYSTMVYSHESNRDISFHLKFADRNSNKYEYVDKLSANFIYSLYDKNINKKSSDQQGFSYLKKIDFEDYNRRKNFGYSLINKFILDNTRNTRSYDLHVSPNHRISLDDEELTDEIIDIIMAAFSFNSEDEIAIPKGITFENHADVFKKLKEKNAEDKWFDVMHFLGEKLSSHSNFVKKELKKISYLGPLRSNPKRYYSIDTEFEVTVGKEGENIAYFLKRDKEVLTRKINDWFDLFDIPYKFTPKPIGERNTEPLIQIQLEDKRNDVSVSPLDVGFGIGQILPILVEGIVREDSVICVEQPEIHLHPKLQAELAEFFVETSTSNQWIIETHSEALLLRIQKLMRNKKKINGKTLKPEDISILYVLPSKNKEDGAQVVQIRLDEDGDFIDFWPEGFFEERIKERR
ncbi:AAA family ATPase [Acinetobacter sp. SwsAc6]|uniref:DUF3696 domain-containing protein n=1 Tax=Acinetobacter sp. SwsAc6 TaxID=2749439 RepID=UPI0015BC9E83|nr:AAA family ATPase [Acinetobacter sp. SwsAc6]NWK75834.1 AAA family ATPase [Acinetobacter sp. SwsAc6]